MPDFFLDSDFEHVGMKTGSTSKNFGDGQVARIFSAIHDNLTPDLVKMTGAVFQFNVKGNKINIS